VGVSPPCKKINRSHIHTHTHRQRTTPPTPTHTQTTRSTHQTPKRTHPTKLGLIKYRNTNYYTASHTAQKEKSATASFGHGSAWPLHNIAIPNIVWCVAHKKVVAGGGVFCAIVVK